MKEFLPFPKELGCGEVVISGAEGLSKTVFSEALSWLKLETDKGPLF